MKYITIVILASLALFARENPFRPLVSTSQDSASDVPAITFHSLSTQELSFPNDAKIIRKIAAQYQKYDGTTGMITKEINEELDWRKPVIISQASNKKFQAEEPKNSLLQDSSVVIETSCELKESFMIEEEPRRFVVDLVRKKGGKPSIHWTQTQKLSRVIIGKHASKVRIVFYVSRTAKPNLKPASHGYSLEF